MKEQQVGVELCFPTPPAPLQEGLGHSFHIQKGHGSLLILQGVHFKSIYSTPRLFFLCQIKIAILEGVHIYSSVVDSLPKVCETLGSIPQYHKIKPGTEEMAKSVRCLLR